MYALKPTQLNRTFLANTALVLSLSGLAALLTVVEWYHECFTWYGFLSFGFLYTALALLSVRITSSWYVGLENVAALSALLSIGLAGTLVVVLLGQILHTAWEFWQTRQHDQRLRPRQHLYNLLTAISTTIIALWAAQGVYLALGGSIPFVNLSLSDLPTYLLTAATFGAIWLGLSAISIYSTKAEIPKVAFTATIARLILIRLLSLLLVVIIPPIYNNLSVPMTVLMFCLVLVIGLLVRINELAQTNLRNRIADLQLLTSVGQSFSADVTFEGLMETLKAQVTNLLDAAIFYVAIYDPMRGQINFPVVMENGERRQWKPLLGNQGITGYIIRTGKPFLMRGTLDATNSHLAALNIERTGRPSACYLGVPMVAENEVYGVIAVQSYTNPHAFDMGDQTVLLALATQAAVILRNLRLWDDLFGLANKLAVLNQVSAQVNASLDLGDIAAATCGAMREVSGARDTCVWLTNPATGRLELLEATYKADVAVRVGDLPMVQGVLVSQQPLIIANVFEDSRAVEWREPAREISFKGVAVLPLLAEQSALGVLVALFSEGCYLLSSELDLIATLTNQSALAFRNAQKYRQIDLKLEARIEELTAIERIARKISGVLNLENIIGEVLQSAVSMTRADWGGIALLPDITSSHAPHLERYYARDALAMHTIELGRGIVSRVLRAGKPSRLDEIPSDDGYPLHSGSGQMRSELCVPILYKGKCVGVIDLASRSPRAFDANHERFVFNLAEHAALALGTTQLFKRREDEITTLQRVRGLALNLLSGNSMRAVLWHIADTVLKIIHNGSVHVLLYEGAGGLEQPAYLPAPQGLIIPIQRGSQTLGDLVVLLDDPADFSDNLYQSLELVALQAAAAIQNWRLFEQIRATNDRMEVVLNSAREGMLLIEANGTLMLANQTAEAFLAHSLQEVEGKPISSVPSLAPISQWLNADRHDSDSAVRLLQIRQPDESTRALEVTALPVLDPSQHLVGNLLVLRDVTEEEALRKFREEAANMLVHDLRAPMTSVVSSLRLLSDLVEIQAYHELDSLIQVALASADNQLNMIESLLDIARLESGRVQISCMPVSPFELAQLVLTSAEAPARAANITLLNLISPNFPHIFADFEQMRRVLSNLVDNALRHTPVGGQIRVTAAPGMLQGSPMAQISITDTGKGIPADQRQHIFEKFMQIDKSAVRGSRGFGLGLTFCKLTIEAHGGTIWVESGPEGGASFVFVVPLVAESLR